MRFKTNVFKPSASRAYFFAFAIFLSITGAHATDLRLEYQLGRYIHDAATGTYDYVAFVDRDNLVLIEWDGSTLTRLNGRDHAGRLMDLRMQIQQGRLIYSVPHKGRVPLAVRQVIEAEAQGDGTLRHSSDIERLRQASGLGYNRDFRNLGRENRDAVLARFRTGLEKLGLPSVEVERVVGAFGDHIDHPGTKARSPLAFWLSAVTTKTSSGLAAAMAESLYIPAEPSIGLDQFSGPEQTVRLRSAMLNRLRLNPSTYFLFTRVESATATIRSELANLILEGELTAPYGERGAGEIWLLRKSLIFLCADKALSRGKAGHVRQARTGSCEHLASVCDRILSL